MVSLIFRNRCEKTGVIDWVDYSLVWNHMHDFKITRARNTISIWNHKYYFRPNCTTRSSINILSQPFWNRRIQSVPALILFDQIASLLKSRNKKAFSSHFVPETEMMQYRAKMVWFKTEMKWFKTRMMRFQTEVIWRKR